MSMQLDGDLGVIDDVAARLLAADDGAEAAERKVADRYAADSRLHPGDRCFPTRRGASPVRWTCALAAPLRRRRSDRAMGKIAPE
jgi:hypothetical protein